MKKIHLSLLKVFFTSKLFKFSINSYFHEYKLIESILINVFESDIILNLKHANIFLQNISIDQSLFKYIGRKSNYKVAS